MKILAATGLSLAIAACSSSGVPQVVSGHVDQSTFPNSVDRVSAFANGQQVSTARVGSQGEFSLGLTPGATYRIEFDSSTARVGLVQPRSTGTVDVSFAVHGSGAAFDIGLVRWIGATTSTTFHYESSSSGDGECENGVDTTTNQPCVDDNGAACQDNQSDGETADGQSQDPANSDGETADDVPSDSAVAEHNVPSSIGCDNQSDGETND